MFDALVVSVVADEDRPEICVVGIVGNLAKPIVPEVILDALVVSVVADEANPETAPEEMAIATLAALVILPVASTI